MKKQTVIFLNKMKSIMYRAFRSLKNIYNIEITQLQEIPKDESREFTTIYKSEDAEKLNGTPYTEFALKNHNHDDLYYKKTDTVQYAKYLIDENGNPISPTSLAPVNHIHNEYYKKGEKVKFSFRLGGKKFEDYATASHEHEGYVGMQEIVDATYKLGGQPGTDFALAEHSHADIYHSVDDTVMDAAVLVDATGKKYTADLLAKKDHEHDDLYYRKEEFDKIFLKKGMPFGFTEKVKVTVYDVDVSSASIQLESGSYGTDSLSHTFLQIPSFAPYVRPEATAVTSSVSGPHTYDAKVMYLKMSVTVGSYSSINLPSYVSKIVGIIGSRQGVNVGSNNITGFQNIDTGYTPTSGGYQAPLFITWTNVSNPKKVLVYAYPFGLDSGGASLVDLIIFYI